MIGARGANDALEEYARRHRYAQNWLTALELLHKLCGAAALLAGATVLGFNLRDILREIGRSGFPAGIGGDDVAWLLLGLAGVVYAGVTFYSAHLIERHSRRRFSLWWSVAHAVTMFGIPLALLTWMGLRREAVMEMYGEVPSPFEELRRAQQTSPAATPPPLPR